LQYETLELKEKNMLYLAFFGFYFGKFSKSEIPPNMPKFLFFNRYSELKLHFWKIYVPLSISQKGQKQNFLKILNQKG
jgi:hypothetical protein